MLFSKGARPPTLVRYPSEGYIYLRTGTLLIKLFRGQKLALDVRVFSRAYITRILTQQSEQGAQFFGLLLKEGHIKSVTFKSQYRSVTLFHLKEATDFELAIALKPRGFLCYATAAFLHGLSVRPETVTVNAEQSEKPRPDLPLSQANINRAFRRPGRVSNLVYRGGNLQVQIVAGKQTRELGVEPLRIEGVHLPVTTLERTLVDSAVRPEYGGGPKRILHLFRASVRRVDLESLFKILNALDYVYPYHQRLGYYLSRAGIPARRLEPLADLGLKYEFYLERDGPVAGVAKDWRIFLPPGMR